MSQAILFMLLVTFFAGTTFALDEPAPQPPPTQVPAWIRGILVETSHCATESPELRSMLQDLSRVGDEANVQALPSIVKAIGDAVKAKGMPQVGPCYTSYGAVDPERFFLLIATNPQAVQQSQELVRDLTNKDADKLYVATWNYQLASHLGLGSEAARPFVDAALKAFEAHFDKFFLPTGWKDYETLLKTRGLKPRPRTVLIVADCPESMDDPQIEFSSLREDFSKQEREQLQLLVALGTQVGYWLPADSTKQLGRRLHESAKLLARMDIQPWLGRELSLAARQLLRTAEAWKRVKDQSEAPAYEKVRKAVLQQEAKYRRLLFARFAIVGRYDFHECEPLAP